MEMRRGSAYASEIFIHSGPAGDWHGLQTRFPSAQEDFESQSLLNAEYHQENVPFTVIAVSESSTRSAAGNSRDNISFAAPSPADLHSNITIPPNPHVSTHPSLNSPVSGTIDEVRVELFKDLSLKPGHCASLNLPPFQNGLQGRVDTLDSAAALFWRRCNEVGCTEAIFTELTRQLSGLAEKVTSQNATQQDMEHQEKQLQRKRKALSDAKAVLMEKQFI
ncbi:hypothetical protein Baya_8601 [Bagarius yarrelli]|uniref:Uncharacterized protein n=1 Tax=Bagarius yarrelli TaxID=175774 RepID=A0A556U4F4_BAGYA|nr:hypothetical protein Baya_8601 [Bagarius yarrelli]